MPERDVFADPRPGDVLRADINGERQDMRVYRIENGQVLYGTMLGDRTYFSGHWFSLAQFADLARSSRAKVIRRGLDWIHDPAHSASNKMEYPEGW